MTQTVLDLVGVHVRRAPDRIAVRVDGQSISYGELWASAERLAERLINLGVGRDYIVGVLAEPNIDMVVSILGVLLSGGSYMPLEPSYPASRLQHMLADSQPSTILATRAHAARLEWEPFWRAPGRTLAMVDSSALTGSRNLDREPIQIEPDQLAYTVYTSGSTGSPKGVQIAHAGLADMIRAQIEIFDVRPESRVLQFASFSFDASVSEVFIALCSGAELILARRAAMIPGERLLSLLREHQISVVTLPPSVLATLPPDGLPDLATVVSAGEPCSAEVVDAWAVGRRFVNAYGPSEVTVCATAAVCTPQSGPPSIGRALPHLRTYVLDDDLAPVAAGQSGHLYLAGSALARGYARRPGTTAAVFLPDPFSTVPGARMYRTGDVVSIDDHGALRFVGRADQQVKIRGYRIEPGEIESALRTDPAILDARVIPFTASGDRRLAAYIIRRDNREVDAEEIRHRLRARLPAFMIPTRIIAVDHWPLSPNGKLDLAALPSPQRELIVRAQTYAVPRDSFEQHLAEIWEELLDRAPIGINDDFFHLGGHSLLALRLARRIQSVVGATCSVNAIAEHPTIKQLARHLRAPEETVTPSPVVLLQAGDDEANPLFLAAPIHGNPLCYLPLVRLLGIDQPCYGLRPVGAVPATIAEFATSYIDAMRSVRPLGPYRIAGWSFGGLIAFEMARQLRAHGDELELFAIIDATVPTTEHCIHARRVLGEFPMPAMAYMFVRNTLFSINAPIDLPDLPPDLYEGMSALDIYRDVLARLVDIEAAPPGMTVDDVSTCLELFRSSLQAMYSYDPGMPFEGHAVVFESEDGHPGMAAGVPRGSWSELIAGPIQTRIVPGNHFTVCHPANVERLAAELATLLAATDSR